MPTAEGLTGEKPQTAMTFFLISVGISLVWVGYLVFYNKVIYPSEVRRFEACLSTGELDAAEQVLAQLPGSKQKSARACYGIFELAAKRKQWTLALFHLNELLQKKPYREELGEVKLRLAKAELYRQLGKKKEELKEYYRVVRLEEKNQQAIERLGELLFEMRNFHLAEGYLLEATQFETKGRKKNYVRAELLAELYFVKGDYNQALHFTEKALAEAPVAYCRLLEKKAILCYLLKRYQAVGAAVAQLQASYKKSALLLVCLGLTHYKQGEREQALVRFKASLSKHTADSSALTAALRLEARLCYKKMLLEKRELELAYIQMQFIETAARLKKADAQENAEQKRLYGAVLANNKLKELFEASSATAALKKMGAGLERLCSFDEETSNEEMFSQEMITHDDWRSSVIFSRSSPLAPQARLCEAHCFDFSPLTYDRPPFSKLKLNALWAAYPPEFSAIPSSHFFFYSLLGSEHRLEQLAEEKRSIKTYLGAAYLERLEWMQRAAVEKA